MTDHKITDNIPNESAIHDLIEDFSAQIQQFPESKLVPIWQNAIDELTAELKKWHLPH